MQSFQGYVRKMRDSATKRGLILTLQTSKVEWARKVT